MASSQRQKRPIFIVFWILATLAIVALGLYFYRYQTLKTSLFGTKIQNLKIDGQTGNFELNNGDVYLNGRKESYLPRDFQVLALGNFYLSAKEDPLFASAGLNATEYSSTIDYLDKEQQTLMSSLHLTHDIIPIQFLKSIGDVKTASDTFYANPTSENAKSLLDQYQTSQKIYQESLDAFQKKIQTSYPGDKDPTFVNIGSAIDPKTVLANIAVMKKNNEALRQEIAKRAGILSGLAAYNGVNAVAPVTISSESSTTPILSKNQLALKDSEKATLQGPYLINTACFTGKEQSSLLYIATRVEINGHAFNLPKLATDNFYQKLNPKLPNEKRLIDAGYPWHYVSEGNTYRCNELEYQPRLFTIQLFIDKYKENPLLPTILSSNYVQTLSQADQNELKNISNQEAKFLAGKNIGDKELSDLTNGYLETYKTLKKLSDTSDSKLKDQNEALNRFLYLRDRQAALSELFNSSLSLGDLNYRFQQGFLKSNSTFNDYLYLGRSAYALTYLNFSPSVWRIAEKPNYINSALSRVDNSGTPYATFTELLKKYTAAQIVSWHKIDELDIIRPLGN